MYLSDEIKTVDLSDFKIKKISATKDFILVKTTKECPVYFTFFSHFISVAGDYGEWTLIVLGIQQRSPFQGMSIIFLASCPETAIQKFLRTTMFQNS